MYKYLLLVTLFISNTLQAPSLTSLKNKATTALSAGWKSAKETLHLERKKQLFCSDLPNPQEPSIYDSKSPTDEYSELILKHSPVAYLHEEEQAYPMSALQYFEHKNTQIVSQPNHRKDTTGNREVLLARGQVTSKALFELSQSKQFNSDIFTEIDSCITAGAAPEDNTDSDGNLTTPAYVKAKEVNGKLYITYIFFYGFNYPYQLKMPFFRIPLPPGQIINAHESDVEHITQEFEKQGNEWELSRIFYGAHGSAEGLWLDAQDASKNPSNIEITFEDTHPVVFIAKGGHGCYPDEGTYVRIFGFANDRTDKNNIRWTPSWVRLHEPEEEAFKPEIHGWLFLPGDFGAHGVTALGHQKWFKDPTTELNAGNTNNRHFCPKSTLQNICISAKTAVALPPTK